MSNSQYPQYPQQQWGQPAPQWNGKPPQNKTIGKAVAITIGVFASILILLLVVAFLGLRASQNAANEKPIFYSSYGGYAETESEVNTDLQSRLDDRTALIELINENYDIKGVHILNQLDEHYFGYSGEAKETEKTAVRVETDIYLTNDLSDFRELVADVDKFFTERGWTFEDSLVDLVNEYQFDSSIGGISSDAHKDDQHIYVSLRTPSYDATTDPDFLGTKGIWLEIWDNTEAAYPLSEIPVWDGQLTDEERDAKYDPWVGDPENPDNVEKYCSVGENSYIGYWDSRWDCLHAEVYRVDTSR